MERETTCMNHYFLPVQKSDVPCDIVVFRERTREKFRKRFFSFELFCGMDFWWDRTFVGDSIKHSNTYITPQWAMKNRTSINDLTVTSTQEDSVKSLNYWIARSETTGVLFIRSIYEAPNERSVPLILLIWGIWAGLRKKHNFIVASFFYIEIRC